MQIQREIHNMTPEQALACLSLIVAHGKKSLIVSLKKDGLSAEMADLFTTELQSRVNKDTLFSDPHFEFALRLATTESILDTAVREGPLKGMDWQDLFLMQLLDIFPKEFAKRLFTHELRRIEEDKTNGRNPVPTNETHKQWLQEVMDAAVGPVVTSPYRKTDHKGTDSWMVACPKCQTEKRCFAKTKRFQCKNRKCDFDQPYPFQPAS